MTIDEIMRRATVIPVLILDGSVDPAALAETLVEAGLPVLEVTLRTPQALDAIRAMSRVPGAIVGAGTVLNAAMLDEAMAAGSHFIVSPGLTQPLAEAASAAGIPFLPGVANPGDIMRGLDFGFTRFKFFPAEASGGRAALTTLSGPFADARFCPTGGVRPDNAADWLAHPAVLCVGGSWIVRRSDKDLDGIAARAREAANLRRSAPAASEA